MVQAKPSFYSRLDWIDNRRRPIVYIKSDSCSLIDLFNLKLVTRVDDRLWSRITGLSVLKFEFIKVEELTIFDLEVFISGKFSLVLLLYIVSDKNVYFNKKSQAQQNE